MRFLRFQKLYKMFCVKQNYQYLLDQNLGNLALFEAVWNAIKFRLYLRVVRCTTPKFFYVII